MFTQRNLQLNRGTTTANGQGNYTTVDHSYKDKSATLANILLNFPPYLGQGVTQDVISVGDIMLVNGSDGVRMSEILALDPFTLGADLFLGMSSTLSVGAPIAPVDGNAAKITGDILQIEYADKTHPGSLSTASQDISGAKTLWAKTTIIPNNNIVVSGTSVTDLVIKTQDSFGGVQLQTDTITNIMSYGFGTTNLGGAYAGMVFSEDGFASPSGPILLISNNGTSGLVMDSTGKVNIPVQLNVDTLSELTALNGTDINGTNIKATSITMADTNVVWDNGILAANTVRFGFDSGDYLSYDKTANDLSLSIANVPVFGVSATSGIQSDIGFDRITAGTLNLGSTNATFINLAQDTAVAASKVFHANIIDSTTAGLLTIGNGNATLIELNQVTTVVPTVSFNASNIDAATTGPIFLGLGSATSIHLQTDAVVSVGKILQTNTLDATTSGALTLGNGTATSINLAQDTSLAAGKTLTTNAIDATTAVPLVIGNSTATEIDLNENTVVASGKTLTVNGDVFVTDPAAGITVSKTGVGALGIAVTSGDITSYPTMTLGSSNSSKRYGMTYAPDGFGSGIPQLLIYADYNGSAIITLYDDPMDARVEIGGSGVIVADEIRANGTLVVNGNQVNPGHIVIGSNMELSYDTFIADVSIVKFAGGAGTANSLYFDLLTNTFNFTVGATNVIAFDGTTINLKENTYLSAGSTLHADIIDAVTAGGLTIGNGVATFIELNQVTKVASGVSFNANNIDSATTGPIFLGLGTATSVHLQVDTVVSTGKVLQTNTLDATTSGALTLGNGTATSVNTALLVNATGGVKFSGGAGTLNYYDAGALFSSTWTNGALTTGSINFAVTRIGNFVSLSSTAIISTGSQATPGSFFVNNTTLPAAFIPTQNREGFVRILNAGVASMGYVIVDTAGSINIYANIDLTTAFTALSTNTVSIFEINYSLA